MKKLLFIGECRSLTAQRQGWTWKDGRLAAKPLFEALEAMGVDPAKHAFMNLWTDNATGLAPGDTGAAVIAWQKIDRLKAHASVGGILVALGKRVSDALNERGVDHVALVHPAARGKIRKSAHYRAHVKEKLAFVLAPVRKLARVGYDDHSTERFEIQLRGGRWRRLRSVPGNGQYAPGFDEIGKWLGELGVTHVETTNDYCDLPSKVRTLRETVRLVTAFEKEST